LLSEFNSITAQVKVETFMNNINMTFWVIVSSPCLRWYILCIKISRIKLYKSKSLFLKNCIRTVAWKTTILLLFFCGYVMWSPAVREKHKLLKCKNKVLWHSFLVIFVSLVIAMSRDVSALIPSVIRH
jgi:hypothetical protein